MVPGAAALSPEFADISEGNKEHRMKTMANSALVLCVPVCMAASVAAQTPVGALAIDERRGDQYGWAVDYVTARAAQTAALGECGAGCSVVLTFARCAAYAADQDSESTAVGWAESYSSSAEAQQAALGECSSRGGGSGCIVRVWGCNSPVVEDGLGLDRASRREIQRGLQAAGFDPGGADGMFVPRTRSAIRRWQTSRGERATGYLGGTSAATLRSATAGQPTFRERQPAGAAAAAPVAAPPAVSAAQQQPSPASSEVEVVFWQSIANSTNPAEFEAYLSQFPNAVFRALAQARLATLRSPGGNAPASVRSGVGGAGSPPGVGTRVSAGVDARPGPGAVFRPDRTCPGQPGGASCWMEISGRPGCHVWNRGYAVGAAVTWTGECSGGLARGTGSLTWVWDGNEQVDTGQLQDGKMNGRWVWRRLGAGINEGPMVDGEQNGHWVIRNSDGDVAEGPIVNGERSGRWVFRSANGNVWEGPYVAGEWHGDWVLRAADGTVGEGPFVDGEQRGHWVVRKPDGQVEEGPVVNGERHGDWTIRFTSGRTAVQRWANGELVETR